MRLSMSVTTSLVLLSSIPMFADQKAFLGRWNLQGTGANADHVYWLEIEEDGGKLTGMFLNRGGSPVPLQTVKVEGDELIFQMAPGRDGTPSPEHRARIQGDKLAGSVTERGTPVQWEGVRPPKWGPADANARHTFGKPVELFDGKSIDTFDLQFKNRPSGWSVVDGAMTNEARANNLISKERFKDFKIHAEYKLDKASNSGIYLRGRYELQVLDDFGKPVEKHGHMSVYAWVAPSANASKPAGEWNTMEATIVGNKLTVVLNGQKVQDNTTIEAITGGALDANETEPGPIMLQGDHGKVWYRKVTVTPIVSSGS
jgi:hypothetical protein